MMKLMRRKKRTWCYFGITIVFTLLGYLKYQSNMRSDRTVLNEAQSHWTLVTEPVIHRSTDGIVHNSTQRGTQQTVASTNRIVTAKDAAIIYGRTNKENSSVSLLQYISNVSPLCAIDSSWLVIKRLH